jgi:glycine hydroxymethyltransferase
VVADTLATRLRASISDQERALRSSLILNPVENVPFAEDLAVVAGPLHGLYNSDKVRAREQRLATDHQFAGRQVLEADSRVVYEAWADALGAEDATLRILSGLHAHIVLFMAMARAGETVLLLPVEAGGHMSGKAILERLGLTTIDMIVDATEMRVDIDATLALCVDAPPDYVFVDRSEGLTFEDFSALAAIPIRRAVFDASQYLTNIVSGDHPNPFDLGFDLVIGSIHKNFPGPQKALLATRRRDEAWHRILGGVSTFVSNMHVASTYAAGLTLARRDWLARYSQRMLRIAVLLEDDLLALGVPVIERRRDLPPTHHLWICEGSRDRAFDTYEALERCRILTNFRKLPYGLGHGLRFGVNAAVRLGLREEDVPRLAELIAEVRRNGATPRLRKETRAFNEEIWSRS